MPIIVGGVVEKDGKYLLVQEAKASCRGKWNLPAGHLDPDESILDGAKREIKEETNCDVELTGICQIFNKIHPETTFLGVIFTTKILTDSVKHRAEELLDAKLFTYDEILAMKEQLRGPDWIIAAINSARTNHVAPLDLIMIAEVR